MEESRFDAWTRRRFGLATASTVAAVLQLSVRDDAAAKRHRRDKVQRCRKVKQTCKRRGKFACCDRVRRLECDKVGFSQSSRCCYDYQTLCSGAGGECCRDLSCGTVPALSGRRCCAEAGAPCRTANDCCEGIPCNGGFCVADPLCLEAGAMCPNDCDQGGSCSACCSGDCDANRHCT